MARKANVYGIGKSILADAIQLGPETTFTLHRGSVDRIAYGIVRRADGSDVCTATWNESAGRWSGIEFVEPGAIKCNRTRQAAMKCLQAVERH